MRRLRYGLVVAGLLLCLAPSAKAEVSIGIGLPHVSIGINLPYYPEFVLVPGYPVYYAPRIYANYFFYDGMYWVYHDDYWYASDWFNGPWWLVEPEFVPLFLLRIPVRYYLRPPVHFHRWHSHEPPRWGEHWGHDWERKRHGWDRWERDSIPAPAPLPVYQRYYSGERYPRMEEQRSLRDRNYRYQPRDTVIRDHIQPRVERRAPAPDQRERDDDAAPRGSRQPDIRRPEQSERGGPGSPPQYRGGEDLRRETSPPVPAPPRQRGSSAEEQRRRPEDAQREQFDPRPRGQDQWSRDREPERRSRGSDDWSGSRRDRGREYRRGED